MADINWKHLNKNWRNIFFLHLNASGAKAEIHEKARGWLLGHPPDQGNCQNILKPEVCRSKPVAIPPALRCSPCMKFCLAYCRRTPVQLFHCRWHLMASAASFTNMSVHMSVHKSVSEGISVLPAWQSGMTKRIGDWSFGEAHHPILVINRCICWSLCPHFSSRQFLSRWE